MGFKNMKRRTPALITWPIGVASGAVAVASRVLPAGLGN